MLTEEQTLCVHSMETRIGVMAGAGTGKTSVVVARIRHLLDIGVNPRSIVAFTFTKAAAKELRQRLGDDAEGMRVGTFHSIGLELNNQLQVLDEHQSLPLVGLALSMAGVKDPPGKWIKRLFERKPGHSCQVTACYESILNVSGCVDYRGLLLSLLAACKFNLLHEIRHVIVDEAQDTDSLQWEIVDTLIENGAGLFAVGDIKQSIYGWRGARYQDFTDRCPVIYHLTESFRNPPDGVCAANAIISASGMEAPPLRTSKTEAGITLSGDPPSVCVQRLMREELFAPSDIAVICRTNSMVHLVQDSLAEDGIRCADLAGNQEKMNEIKSLLSLIAYPNDFNRKPLLKAWSFGTEESTPEFLRKLWDLSEYELGVRVKMWRDSLAVKPTVSCVLNALAPLVATNDGVELWNNQYGDWGLREALQDLAVSSITPTRSSGVTVCTTHQAKGLEFPATVVVCESHRLNEESYRVFYVALTRFRERCILTDTHAKATEFMQIVRTELMKWKLA